MPRPNLHLAQPVVRDFCRVRDISYAELSPIATYAVVAGHLHAVGAELRGAAPPR